MKKDGLVLQYYAVCYLDIMNQRENIQAVTEVPITEEARKRALEKMRGSYGLIIKVREMIGSLISILNQRGSETPKEYHPMLEKIVGNPLCVHRIGDAFVIYFPLGVEKGKIALFGVHKQMMAAAGIHLTSLSFKTPVRGSLTIGLGMEIEENELYGPAVVRAYDIEQKEADWMRIVMDPSVVEFLNKYNLSDRGIIPQTLPDKMASYFYDSCAKFVEIDHDGRYVLNYLQQDFLNHIPDRDERIEAAKRFLKGEHERFKAIGHSSATGAKIAQKYKMTLDYFTDHC